MKSIDLISIHIPKTAGTSFYYVLQQVFGSQLSPSLRRRDLQGLTGEGRDLMKCIGSEVRVLHGHYYYQEVRWIHQSHSSKVVCWIRDPVDRVISNFHFFKAGLRSPERNRDNYFINKHRKKEGLIAYAEMIENRNRMSRFLEGLDLGEFFFIGFVEHFNEDLHRLAAVLNWPSVRIPKLNQRIKTNDIEVDQVVRQRIGKLNAEDVDLYQNALANR